MEKQFFGKRPTEGALQGNATVMSPEQTTEDAIATIQAQEMGMQTVIGTEQIHEAQTILNKYKQGKANLEKRIVDDELWWELRHWEVIRAEHPDTEPTSAWLFNCIVNKHADAMDNYPSPIVLPRELSDKDSAERLQEILPVIMEYNNFEETYSDGWWEKLKHGTAAYLVTWNKEKENGLGDIDIQLIDLLNIYYEPGIKDIQDSRNLFITELIDREILSQQYPDKKDSFAGSILSTTEYIYDDTVDNSNKCVVVDWYYKVRDESGRTVLHYCKFCGDAVLYATENDPNYAQRGFYDHGKYPLVLDCMFPEKGTPIGFGYVSICKDPQLYIDKMSGYILKTAMMGSKKRFFISASSAVNEEDFTDWSKDIVRVEGELGDERLREINITPPSPIYQNLIDSKINEMKETAANRDVQNGSAGAGITSGAAISALQEAGNKVSRDMISASYRTYRQIVGIVIELIRQFYDIGRSFRITGKMPGEMEFVEMSNASIRNQETGIDSMGNVLYRKPIFDLKIKAQKTSPFSRMEENERAKELYALGFFSPERAQESSLALSMMDFEGIENIKQQVAQGQTLYNIVMQQNQLLMAMMGQQPVNGVQEQNEPKNEQNSIPSGASNKVADSVEQPTPNTRYQRSLMNKAKPDMNSGNGKVK